MNQLRIANCELRIHDSRSNGFIVSGLIVHSRAQRVNSLLGGTMRPLSIRNPQFAIRNSL